MAVVDGRGLKVARRVGWSSRHLGERFRAEIGFTPKEAARVARFDRARHLLVDRVISGRSPDLAGLADACGYCDQEHLTSVRDTPGDSDAAVAAVAAGADEVHVHPKNIDGADTLVATVVAAVVEAVRAAAPGTPVGVTTGAWAASSPSEQLAAVRKWQVLPDFASVNWHEPGAEDLATELLKQGVGVEAGLWTPLAVESWNSWPQRAQCLRVLLEVVDDLPAEEAVAAAGRLVDALRPVAGVPVLMHGKGRSAWPVLEDAVRRGLDVRIGLEDVLVLPDGQQAADNAELIAAARDVNTGV